MTRKSKPLFTPLSSDKTMVIKGGWWAMHPPTPSTNPTAEVNSLSPEGSATEPAILPWSRSADYGYGYGNF